MHVRPDVLYVLSPYIWLFSLFIQMQIKEIICILDLNYKVIFFMNQEFVSEVKIRLFCLGKII